MKTSLTFYSNYKTTGSSLCWSSKLLTLIREQCGARPAVALGCSVRFSLAAQEKTTNFARL